MATISLRKIRLSDKKYFTKWWRDRELLELTSGIIEPISDRKVEKYFSAMLTGGQDNHFMILLDRIAIGHIALAKRPKDWYETQIIIGEETHRNQGYGVKAIRLFLDKARRLKVQKVYLEVRPQNLRAIKAYEKCGFVKDGIQKHPGNKYLPEILRMELES